MKYHQVWKTRELDDILLRHCNAVYNHNAIDRWTMGCIFLFPKKGDLGLPRYNHNGQDIPCSTTQTHRTPKREDNMERTKILSILRILEGVHTKIQEAAILFVDFAKAFDSIHRGKMEQILLAYGLPKETVAAIMMLYGNTKVKVHPPGWGYRLLRHCSRYAVRRHISLILLYHLSRQRA